LASDVRIVTKNGLYDFGWLWADLGIAMPPAERLEEIDALATMVDENRYKYSLAAPARGSAQRERARNSPMIPTPRPIGLRPPSISRCQLRPRSPPNSSGTRNGKILCPFHAEKTPSCQLYSDGHYHCFGCGAHGWIDDDLDLDPTDIAPSDDGSRNLQRAQALWDAGRPIAGTLAERYLTETRRLDPGAIGADVLRFHPHCPFNGAAHPCLLARFSDAEQTGLFAGIHRVALTPDAQKIERFTLGRWPAPRVIKLWPATTALVVGEGIETVIAAVNREIVGPRAWAMGGRGNIAKLPALPGIAALTILVDNDGQARADAETCAARWHAAGRRVRLLTTRQVKDFKDLVRP
jgi:hypothetical protein